MQLKLDNLGMIPATYPAVWFRVENWMTGRFIADFDNEAEAVKFSYASNHGGKYDHKVSRVSLSGR